MRGQDEKFETVEKHLGGGVTPQEVTLMVREGVRLTRRRSRRSREWRLEPKPKATLPE